MKRQRLSNTTKTLLLRFPILLITLITACQKDELTADIEVYSNDFESNNLNNIIGGRILPFDGGNVIGNYNNDGFRLHLNDLPDHKYIYISFDILIHDSWDGNTNGFEPDVPDLWIMDLNPGLSGTSVSEYQFKTTFSSGVCDSQLCLWQSYPNNYPFSAHPKTGTVRSAPGLCQYRDRTDGTSVFRIQKTYTHSDPALIVDFYDRLVQYNAVDPKCDESWSIDNLTVRAITIK